MSTASPSFVESVRRAETAHASGSVTLPISYSDASVHGLFYSIATKRAAAVVGGASPFEPWSIAGRTTVLVCSFEYRESTIGAYGEIGIGVLVRKKGSRPSMLGYLRDMRSQPDAGLLIVALPVTTEAANSAGREIWGFPKYVTEMKTDFDRSSDRGRVSVSIASELDIEDGPTLGPRTKGFPFVLMSIARGRILRTVVEVDHEVRWGLARQARVRARGNGPTARVVRELGLGESRPLAVFRTDRMRSVLPAGIDMGAATSASGD